ncbi:MAG: helix-turn-helix domain-containing protein [Phycisphaerae bacterium]|nr:helix-turn-helix domain-containing protein [Phycisphaerae bacterium]
MAKMFYTVDEVKTMLALDDAAIRDLIQQGKLRELHDGPRRVFKADQVDALAAQASSKRPAPADTDATGFSLEMADSTAAGASGTGRADTALGAKDVQPPDEDQLTLADTETPGSAAGTGGSGQDVLQLDGSGSGSGLLDLTREGDDTSLGAVLDEIYPGGEDTAAGASGLGSGIAAGLGTGLASALTPEAAESQADLGPAVDAAQLAQDRLARAVRPFTAGMFLAIALLALAFSAVAAVLQGIMPGYLAFVCQNLLYFLIASLAAALLVFVLGTVLSK